MSSPRGASSSASSSENSLYGLLQLPPTASAAEVRSAYRRLSRVIHPDKHVDASSKKAATDAFARIKEAYEILGDTRLRSIYDAFGLDAARSAASPGNEVVPFEEFGRREGGGGSGGVGGGGRASEGWGSDPYFTVSNSLEPQVDCTGLVAALEDGFWDNGSGLAVLSQVVLGTQATAYVGGDMSLGVQYSLMNRPRAGGVSGTGMGYADFPAGRLRSSGARGLVSAGEMAVTARKAVGEHGSADAAIFLPLDARNGITLTAKASRSLSDRMNSALDATWSARDQGLTLALSFSRHLHQRGTANISWAAGAVPGVSFSYRREAYNEFTDTETKGGGEDGNGKKRERDLFGEASDEEGEECAGGKEEWRNSRFWLQKNEIFPVAALVSQLRPLAIIVSPHVWRPVGYKLSLQVAGTSPSIGVHLRRPIGELAPFFSKSEPSGAGGPQVELRTHVGTSGWEVEAGGGERIVAGDIAWSSTIVVGTHGLMFRIKMQRSGHSFTLPIVLVSSTTDARTATIAAISMSAVVTAVQSLIVKPWRDAAEAEERESAKRVRESSMNQAKSDAEASRELMTRVVEGSVQRESEVAAGGLIIVRAIYGLRRVVAGVSQAEPSFAGREIECEATEVGDCVQMLVEDSRVQMVSATKSTILGFWDPTAMGDEDKALRIWYTFRGAIHDCTVSDWEPLELPLSVHRIS